ncbi:MAG: hypothetical protein HC852_10335 [Acaryochloridaceae cyanobacterium RU_4_10]|nr:hypothetical protein [Acaryochloridaceae cyanobacterium RU_4_10]
MMNDRPQSPRPNTPQTLLHALQGSVLLSALILSAGLTTAQTTKPSSLPQPATLTARPDRQEIQDLLKQIQREREIQSQVKTEADRQFKQTTFLFTVFLAVLGLILAAAIAMLWLLRRASFAK